MSEGLASFFAKKNTKASKKKAIRLDEVAQHLETNLRIQNDGEDTTSSKADRISEHAIAEEDPEWINYDTKLNAPIEVAGIGTFTYTEQPEDEEHQEERDERKVERIRTWKKPDTVGTPNSIESPAADTPTGAATDAATPTPHAEAATAPTPAKVAPYRPPIARIGGDSGPRRGQPPAKVDIKSQDMFPSIGDADRREKEDKVRAEELRKTQLEEAAKRAARAEERAKNVAERNAKEAERAQQYDEQAKQREENQMANQKRREQSEQEAATRKAAEEAAERKKIEEKVNSGKYVPPVQRRRLAPGS